MWDVFGKKYFNMHGYYYNRQTNYYNNDINKLLNIHKHISRTDYL